MGIIEELNSLDINDIGSWTRRVKLVLSGFLCVMIIIAGYYWVIEAKIESLDAQKAKEPALKQSFMDKKALAINLDAYKAQMIEATETFEVLKNQLPNESEIPDLLEDMTQVGLQHGLQFEQIRPGNTIAKDFYAEKLVNVKVNGEYHQIASFISDVAALPRIINVDNFRLTRRGDGGNLLTLEAVTKTYHYLDEGFDPNGG